MRITRNQVPGRLCDLCKQPLEVGKPGANYLPSYSIVRRGHPACVNEWRNRQRLRERSG
jgi:hypothetical protein